MPDSAPLRIEVICALPQRVWRVPLRLPEGSTAGAAIEASGLSAQLPPGTLDMERIGVFAVPVSPETPLRDGDRVEIYRPLQCDPKDVRRARADARRMR